MSKKSKKRIIDKWCLRRFESSTVIVGFEVHAGRWIMDRVIYQTGTTHKGQLTYLFICENHQYKVLRQAHPEEWRF